MDKKERRRIMDERLKEELAEGNAGYLWMSFCDTAKPPGQGFLGVIITRAMGLTHAITKTHELGINPGGEIQASFLPPDNIKPEHLDRLMSTDDLRTAGFIE